ncbi:MAG: HD domain-containing protein [Candidatus Hydrogenedentes bacterium]|nr:HD domain-containing protein [Candidatus Hydrogenedentota bacterium]
MRPGSEADIGATNLATVARLARELDPDPAHAFQVRKLACSLFDILVPLHGLALDARRLLEAAALLHDIGHSRDPKGHHKHSRDIILATPLPEFTDDDRRVVACVARYHRKATPQPAHRVYCDLDRGRQDIVRRMAAILRIADGLDRSHCCSASHVELENRGGEVILLVHQRVPSEEDVRGALRKRDLFEDVYAVRLVIQTRMIS